LKNEVKSVRYHANVVLHYVKIQRCGHDQGANKIK